MKADDVVIDLGPTVPGTYPYKIGEHKGLSFTYFEGSNVFSGTPIPPPKMHQVRPRQHTSTDRWGNIIEETDTLGFSTYHKFDPRNLKIQTTQPTVIIVTEEGVAENFIPVTLKGYDKVGRLIGTQKPKGNVEAIWRDEAGQEIAHQLGNGVISERSIFNALSQAWAHIDSRGERWENVFNFMNKIVKVIWPSGNEVNYTYNENNQRSSETDQMGNTTTFDIDIRGNVIKTTSPMSASTTRAFDRNREILERSNIDGTLSYGRDYWGNPNYKKDLGGAEYAYAYDRKMQLTKQTSTNSGHGTYVDFSQFFTDLPWYEKMHVFFTLPTDQYNNPGQSLTYCYQVGRMICLIDHATQAVINFEYDSENQIIYKLMTYREHLIQEIQTVHDALKRIIWMNDGQAYFVTPYDKNGNSRAVYSYFGGATTPSSSAWNTYNFADQITRERGTLKDGVIVGGDEFGYAGTNFRMTHTKHGQVDALSYNADGLLSERTRSTEDSVTVLGKREYQKNNLPTQVDKYDAPSSTLQNTFNPSNRTTRALQHAGGQRTDSYYKQFTAQGQPQNQRTSYGNVEDDLHSSFTRFDELLLRELGGTRIVDGQSGPYSSVQKHHDANGFLQSVIGAADKDGSDETQNTYVVTDEQGRTLMKFSLTVRILPVENIPIFFAEQARVTRYFYQLDGTLLGSVEQPFWDWWLGDTANKAFKANIDAPPIMDASYPPPYPEQYTAVTGDTFELISQKTKDSPYFAATIAEENGRSLSDIPAPGSSITIPQGIQTHNNTLTRQNYSWATRKVIGPIYPRLILPPPPNPHHSFWVDLFEAVVTIAVMALFPPAGGVLGMVLEGIAEGILIDAADQGIEITFGERKKFSLEELGTSALEGGISAGVQADFPHANLAEELFIQGTVAVSEQYLEIAIHLRKHFDLQRALYQTGANTLSYELHMKEGSYKSQFEKAAIYDVSTAVLQSLVYQQPLDLTNLAAHLIADAGYAVVRSQLAKQQSMTKRANHHYAKAQRAANDPSAPPQKQTGYRPAKHTNGSNNPSEHMRTTSDDGTRRGESALDATANTPAGYPNLAKQDGIGITLKQWQSYLSQRQNWATQGKRLMQQHVQASQAVQPAPLSSWGTELDSAVWAGVQDSWKDVRRVSEGLGYVASRAVWDVGHLDDAATDLSRVWTGTKNTLSNMGDDIIWGATHPQAAINQFVDMERSGLQNVGNSAEAFVNEPWQAEVEDTVHTALNSAGYALTLFASDGVGTAIARGVGGTSVSLGRNVASFDGVGTAIARGVGRTSVSLGRNAVSFFGRGGAETEMNLLKPGMYEMSPKDIRFTQANVGPYFSNGKRVDDLIADLKVGNVKPQDLPPIQVVQKDGKLFSIDNRRLLAFNTAGVDNIPVEIVSLEDPLVDSRFVDRFDPILGQGNYAVVVNKANRNAALDLLYEYDMIQGIHLGY